MLFQTYTLGRLDTNCHLLSGDGSRAVIVDPADNGDRLADLLAQKGLTLEAICLTHVHYDHIGGLEALAGRTGAAVYLHPEELSIAGAMACGLLTVPTRPYPRTLRAGGLEFTVYHTPGHSPGSVCLLAEDTLLSGDTLFFGCCGRTDLPGGDPEQMVQSLRFLSTLPDSLSVFPGHGEETRMGWEKKYNPYLQEAMK